MIKDFLVGPRYTEDELMVRLKFFIGVILGLTLFFIVVVVLYSLIFVTQPMNGISPVDNKFFELIIPIATFLTGTLSGIMLAGNDKDLRAKALEAANKPYEPPPSSPLPTLGSRVEPVMNKEAKPRPKVDDDALTPNGEVTTGYGGKPAPAPAPQPEI